MHHSWWSGCVPSHSPAPVLQVQDEGLVVGVQHAVLHCEFHQLHVPLNQSCSSVLFESLKLGSSLVSHQGCLLVEDDLGWWTKHLDPIREKALEEQFRFLLNTAAPPWGRFGSRMNFLHTTQPPTASEAKARTS